jgi:hypothetical protein
LSSIKTRDSHIKHNLALYSKEREHNAICSSVQSRCFIYRGICHLFRWVLKPISRRTFIWV